MAYAAHRVETKGGKAEEHLFLDKDGQHKNSQSWGEFVFNLTSSGWIWEMLATERTTNGGNGEGDV